MATVNTSSVDEGSRQPVRAVVGVGEVAGLAAQTLAAAREAYFRELVVGLQSSRPEYSPSRLLKDVAPLLDARVSDDLFERCCTAVIEHAGAQGSLAGAFSLLRSVAEEVETQAQLNVGALRSMLNVNQSLSPVPGPVAERLELLPHLVAVALTHRDLAGERCADTVSELGAILELAPPSLGNRVLQRDIKILLRAFSHISDLRLFTALLRSEAGQPGGAVEGYKAFVSLAPRLKIAFPEEWSACKAAVKVAVGRGFQGAREILVGFSHLVHAGCSGHVQRAYLLSMAELPADPSAHSHQKIAALTAQTWSVLPPPTMSCKDLVSSLGPRAGGAGVLERVGRATAACFERAPADEVHWETLFALTGLTELAPGVSNRHRLLNALADVHRGYLGSLAFDIKRLPNEPVTPLARLALEAGSLQLLHSGDFRGFPGHGVVLSRLNSGRLFPGVMDLPSRGRATQRDLTPDQKRCLKRLDQVSILVSPGMLVVQPPEIVRLHFGADESAHFSLVFYSQEQRQPSMVRALLVDSDWLWERIAPCLKSWSPSWSASCEHSCADDVAHAGLRPEEILARNEPGKIVAFDIASPEVLVGGFGKAPPRFGGDNGVVSAEPRLRSSRGPGSAPESTRRALRFDVEVQAYLTETLRYFDAFRLLHARAHLGGPEREAAASEGPLSFSDQRLRPLVDTLKLHHAMTRDGSGPLPTDWMLVSAHALRYSDPPDGDFVLDVRTLSCRVDELPFMLFDDGVPAITPRTAERWLSLLRHRLGESIYQDLRFVERRSLRRL